MLKIVRTPSSRRTGAACFIAAWCDGANMKPMPVSPMHCATAPGVSMMLAPSASSTSALPDFDDTDRPPCLATRAPAAAATNIDAVEMLNVCCASPPVPTMSTRCSASGTSTFVANSRITCAAAAISPIVSFLTRRPTVSAAIITGDTSPLMILRMSDSISSWKISRCSIVRWSASCSDMVIVDSGSGDGRRGRARRSGHPQKVGEQAHAVLGEERLGVELDAFDRGRPVPHAHDLAVVRARAHLERRREARRLDRERVVARRDERRGQAGEHAPLVVRDRRDLPVHDVLRAHDPAAEPRSACTAPATRRCAPAATPRPARG